jgi:hypothetical protein
MQSGFMDDGFRIMSSGREMIGMNFRRKMKSGLSRSSG